MNIYFLEDIRKSYYLLYIYYSNNNKCIENSIFIYNDKIDKYYLYLLDFKKAFPDVNIVSIDEYMELYNFKINYVFLNLTVYSSKSKNFLLKLEREKLFVILNNNSGLHEHERSVLDLNPDLFLFWNPDFIYYLLKSRKSLLLNFESKFEFINLALDKNLLINHSAIDYLIFFPTKMAFECETDVTKFLFDLNEKLCKYSLLSNNIFYKAHQGKVENYFSTNLAFLNLFTSVFRFFNLNILFFFVYLIKYENFVKFINMIIFDKLKEKFNLKNLDYPLIPIEFYLNMKNLSLIGSFSNTLITSSFLNIKFELIGIKDIRSKFKKRDLIVDSSIHLKLNMSFFLNENKSYHFNRTSFENRSFINLPLFNLAN